MATDSTLGRLRPLFLPIYIPTLVYAAGVSILLPVQVLLALQLGFSESAVTLMIMAIGAFSIISSLSAGYVVQWLGEKRAVVSVSALGMFLMVVTTWFVVAKSMYAPVVFVVALVLFDVVDAVWSIARQGLVADLAPADLRGRATNLYGACQRIGKIAGPFIAGFGLLLVSSEWLLPLAALIVLGAAGLLVKYSPPRAVTALSATTGLAEAPPSKILKPLLLLGVGVMVLAMLRTAQESLLPLWGSSGVGLNDSTVAWVVGAAAAMELILFWPAGIALDRWGRMPVVVTALVLMGVGLWALPFSTGFAWFLCFSLLMGLGNGAGSGIVKTMGIDIAPARGRAKFFGWWQAIASCGALAAPALAFLAISGDSLPLAFRLMGLLGIAAAVWMAFWTPRFIPRRAA